MSCDVEILEENGFYSLKNCDFEAKVDFNGRLNYLKLLNDTTLIDNAYENINGKDIGYQYATARSTTIRFESELEHLAVEKIIGFDKHKITLDVYIISKKETEIDFSIAFSVRRFFDYFMLKNEKFYIENFSEKDTDDLLFVNENQNLYFGCVFKENMKLSLDKNQQNILFKLNLKNRLFEKDFFMISFTCSLV